MNNQENMKKRLETMKKMYLNLEKWIDSLPDFIQDKDKKKLKEMVLGDKELKELMERIDSHRPPRFFLVGRTGVGKSSLINALYGGYVARVSDVNSCTACAEKYDIMDGDRVTMEILDTRGLAESEKINDKISAEDMLIEEVNKFSPDVAIMMLNCGHRDDINSDVDYMKHLADKYLKKNSVRLPIVVVLNKSDEMQPTTKKDPSNYPQKKLDNIDQMRNKVREIILKHDLEVDEIIAVSSLIEWKTADGEDVCVEDIDKLPHADREKIEISFDGRYQIDELRAVLEKVIPDPDAQMGLRMAARLKDVVKRIAKLLTKTFSTISGTISLAPDKESDNNILFVLRGILVLLIASLSGCEISLGTGLEFIGGIAGVAVTNRGLDFVARTVNELTKEKWSAFGTAFNSLAAAYGTTLIGNSAISYYIDGKDIKALNTKIREKMNKEKSKE